MTRLDRHIQCVRLGDLCGKIPDGHAPLRKTPRGFSYLAHGQVWVERSNDRLWKVEKVVHYGKGGLKRRITLIPYSGAVRPIEMTEERLCRSMLVWDEAIAAKSRFLEDYWNQFSRGEWDRRQFPTFPKLAAFLGFDPNSGCRVD